MSGLVHEDFAGESVFCARCEALVSAFVVRVGGWPEISAEFSIEGVFSWAEGIIRWRGYVFGERYLGFGGSLVLSTLIKMSFDCGDGQRWVLA